VLGVVKFRSWRLFLISNHSLVSSDNANCGECVKLGFPEKGNGDAFEKGDWVSNHYRTQYVLHIYAEDRYVKIEKDARIFDTSDPGRSESSGAPDLGSPNADCGGPGKGTDGEIGKKGENCQQLGSK
jgi:hypothetical protein